MRGQAVVAQARALIGVRFRFQGRDDSGLDCVGLVARAHQLTSVPDDYDLRMANVTRLLEMIDAFLPRGAGPLGAGDVVLMQAGPAQVHLGLWSGTGLIHAHAGLRRVVETPGPLSWPLLGQWRAAAKPPLE